ncbi:hypothetical protein [Streptomyces boninensis]|uniref:hypothetical protein n=1 Tax=Streptomyces boninensis TaxID=2039455 RepID=UPI003B215680
MSKHHKHDSNRHREGGNPAFQEAMEARNTKYEASQRAKGMSSHFDSKSHSSRTNPQGQRRSAQKDR